MTNTNTTTTNSNITKRSAPFSVHNFEGTNHQDSPIQRLTPTKLKSSDTSHQTYNMSLAKQIPEFIADKIINMYYQLNPHPTSTCIKGYFEITNLIKMDEFIEKSVCCFIENTGIAPICNIETENKDRLDYFEKMEQFINDEITPIRTINYKAKEEINDFIKDELEWELSGNEPIQNPIEFYIMWKSCSYYEELEDDYGWEYE